MIFPRLNKLAKKLQSQTLYSNLSMVNKKLKETKETLMISKMFITIKKIP